MKAQVSILFHGLNANKQREEDREVNEMRSGRETPIFLLEN
jgi:hypothetical protein